MKFRLTAKEDTAAIKNIVASTGLFPTEYLEDMIQPYLENPAAGELWFTLVRNEVIVAFAYCVPEKFTVGTYNLLAIAVEKEMQGIGLGKNILQNILRHLEQIGARILIIETSGEEEFASTRNFYLGLGFRQEAVITDFWQDGADKIIYWKKIA
jgi:ribosomal protein S18 acetylase RimI-like enzyme